MLNVLEGFSIIAIIIGIGYLISRTGLIPKDTGPLFNRFAFFVALPALMFEVLSKADLAIILSQRLLVAGISFFAVALLYALIVWGVKKPKMGQLTLGATSSAMINANNMGLPVAIYVVGDAAQVAPILLFQLVIVTPILLVLLDVSTRGRVRAKDMAMQPVRNPLILGSFLGILVNALNVPVPQPIVEVTGILGGAGIPLILVSFGMSLAGSKILEDPALRFETILATIGKMLLMPIIVYLLARYAFEMSSYDVFAATMLSCLPTAQNAFNYASRYQTATVLVRDIVLLTTVISLPVMLIASALLHR